MTGDKTKRGIHISSAIRRAQRRRRYAPRKYMMNSGPMAIRIGGKSRAPKKQEQNNNPFHFTMPKKWINPYLPGISFGRDPECIFHSRR